jgi:hypothetical protein
VARTVFFPSPGMKMAVCDVGDIHLLSLLYASNILFFLDLEAVPPRPFAAVGILRCTVFCPCSLRISSVHLSTKGTYDPLSILHFLKKSKKNRSPHDDDDYWPFGLNVENHRFSMAFAE